MTKPKKKPKEIKLPSRKDYQPSRKELREEFNMPGADKVTVNKTFFQPIKVVESKED